MKKILLLSFSLLLLFACKKDTATVFDHTYWKGTHWRMPSEQSEYTRKLVFATEGLCTEYILDTLTGKFSINYLNFSANGKNVKRT